MAPLKTKKLSLTLYILLVLLASGGVLHSFQPADGKIDKIVPQKNITNTQNISSQSDFSKTPKTGVEKGPFTVVVTLFDITNKTGNIVVFVNVGKTSAGTVVNASARDIADLHHDGITDIGVVINNATLLVGEKFQACVMPLESLNATCGIGYNAPSPRYEYVDLTLDPTKR